MTQCAACAVLSVVLVLAVFGAFGMCVALLLHHDPVEAIHRWRLRARRWRARRSGPL